MKYAVGCCLLVLISIAIIAAAIGYGAVQQFTQH